MEQKEQGRQASRRAACRRGPGAELVKNLSVAVVLVVCAVLLRGGEVPALTASTDVVLDAMSEESLLDEHLGRLSFVSSLFPETALVFGEQTEPESVLTIASSEVVHGWREEEPYLAWQAEQGAYASPVAGLVTDIRRDPDGGWSVLLDRAGDDTCCVFGGLASLTVREGDTVSVGVPLGESQRGGVLTMEIRRNGRNVWPDGWVCVTE